MIEVFVVDDHDVVRHGLRFMLQQHKDIQVVGESGDGREAIQQIADLLPDVVLLDLIMPNMQGVEVLREIKRLVPSTHVIILTSYYDDEHIFSAIKAGALSYLLKESSSSEIVSAIRAAAQGENKLHPMVASRLLREIQERRRSPLDDLTPREIEVLKRLARGRSNYEIATELTISEPTVRTHVSNILSKLHLTDRTQAAIYALQKRLVALDEALEDEED